eukprot:scaffold45236_cov71-Phaeocystis_antarctica.AAC.7
MACAGVARVEIACVGVARVVEMARVQVAWMVVLPMVETACVLVARIVTAACVRVARMEQSQREVPLEMRHTRDTLVRLSTREVARKARRRARQR